MGKWWQCWLRLILFFVYREPTSVEYILLLQYHSYSENIRLGLRWFEKTNTLAFLDFPSFKQSPLTCLLCSYFGATTLSITTFSIMTFSKMTPSITTLGIMKLSIMIPSITTLSIMTFSINLLFATLCIMTFSITAECCSAECPYTECYGALIFTQNRDGVTAQSLLISSYDYSAA